MYDFALVCSYQCPRPLTSDSEFYCQSQQSKSDMVWLLLLIIELSNLLVWDWNGHALLIVMHWTTLMDELSQQKLGSVMFILSEASFVCQTKSQEL